MTVVRVTPFNVNQFSKPNLLEAPEVPSQQAADLRVRMEKSDVLLLQETVNIDLAEFVKTSPGWGAFQIRHGDNDGHANTSVLYRLERGPIADTDCTFLVDTRGERRRYLAGVQQAGVWYWSAHINPKRFSGGIPTQLAHIGAWVKAHPGPHVGGLDRNQCPPGALEHATGLAWHGVGMDGLLTNLPTANVAEFPKGFSDHPGVHADVTLPDQGGDPVTTPTTPKKKTRIQRLLASMWAALHHFRTTGQKRKAARVKAGIDAVNPPPKPPPAPKPPKPAPAAPHGFMPGAVHLPIPAGSSDPAITPVGVIQHIAVSNADSLHALFSNDGGIESHFYIRKDGTIEQYRSIYFEADAQFAGNSFGSPRKGFVSVEHQGGVGADLNSPMPKPQLDAFHKVIQFVHAETGFPLRVCPAWDQGGVGYHALFDQWNTNHHSCPGAARITQFRNVTVPWLAAGAK